MRTVLLLLLLVACAPAEPPPTTPEATATPTPTPAPTPASTRIDGVLAEGTDFATPWLELRGAEPGPALLVQAGIHGDEIAGTLALDALIPRLEVTRGRLVVLPRMNRPAVEAGRRFLNEDLNLVFPGEADGSPYERQLAAALFAWTGERQVDVVLTLHESRYLHDGTDGRTFGQTIVYGVKPMPELVQRVLDRMNADVVEPRQRFWPNYFPIDTSSTEQIVAKWGVLGFAAETWRGFELETRVALQTELILAFMDEVGVGYSVARPPLRGSGRP